MMDIITSSPLFGLFISFFAFGVGTILFNRFKTPLLNPLLLAIIACIAFVQTGIISYDKYVEDTAILANLLPAATALLAVNTYKQLKTV
ncbi:MAG: LrgB family protein, partial [Oscillospiraceae bacterium]|nr:LrgB family protein [Oscillospiraceae bacterium]